METEKMIEEMAEDLENHTCMSRFQAEIASRMLYAKGYRKIPEGTVVLTKEECGKLGLVVETIQEYETKNGQPKLVKERKVVRKLRTDFCDLLNQEIKDLQISFLFDEVDKARKETARGILFMMESAFGYYDDEDMFSKKAILECVEAIAKQFGVEIEG